MGTDAPGRVREAGAAALSYVQQGVIVQDEFAKFVTIGTTGQVELFTPVSDDQRIDVEAQIKRRFMIPLAIQVKGSSVLQRNHTLLKITFDVSDEAWVSHDLFYYFFAHLNPAWLGVVDPVFFAPSAVVHRHADPKRRANGHRQIEFVASIEPRSRDQWTPYRLSQFDLGTRVRGVLEQARRRRVQAAAIPSPLFRVPGVMWGGIAPPGGR
ncbi:MAG TPA: hypothetical protein VET65_08805 [Candidatus Limnocylindrales bacterium]|nr:hypothetical protein [Candidatus Limnocylindrales bacterium]